MEFSTLEKITFDIILEERIRFGFYQKVTLATFGLIDFMDGIQLINSVLLLPIFKNVFDIPTNNVPMMASIFYVGVFLGAANAGRFGDRSGRKKSALFGIFIQIFFTFSLMLSFDFYSLLVNLLLYGLSFGFTLPLTTTMVSETTTLNYRGLFLLLLNLFVSFGKLYSICIAFYTLDHSLKSGNWELYLLICVLPSLLTLFMIQKYIVESPRFLLKSLRFNDAFQSINFMIASNNKNESILGSKSLLDKELTENEKGNLISEFEQTGYNFKAASLSDLFQGDLKFRTLYFWAIWFFLNIMYLGQLMIIPFIMKTGSKSLRVMAITTLGEIPSIFLSFFLIEKESFGRKNSLIFFFTFAGFFHILSCLSPLVYLTYILPIARFFMKCSFSMIYAFTSEAHPTLIRTLAYGWCTAIGKFGGFIMPYIMFFALEIDSSLPFLIMGISAFLASFSTFKIGIDTRGKHLEAIEKLIVN